MAGEDGLDYSELSDKQQMGYYKKLMNIIWIEIQMQWEDK